jgi:hypothetical protein
MTERPPTSFRLSPQCRALLEQLGQALGLKATGVIELAVRRLAKQELPPGPPPEPPARRPGRKRRKPKE